MCPTRELALQVTDHLNAVLALVCPDARAAGKSAKAVAVVGGLAEVKQQKRLSRRPAIVVATPGRLWALLQQGEEHVAAGVKAVRFLVLDEADRLMDKGHFVDLTQVLAAIPPARRVRVDGKGVAHCFPPSSEGEPVRQGLLFSATYHLPMPRNASASSAAAAEASPPSVAARGQRDRRGGGRGEEEEGWAEDEEGWGGLGVKQARRSKGKHVRQRPAAAVNMVKAARRLLKMPAKPIVVKEDAPERLVASRVKQVVVKCRQDHKDNFLFFFLRHNPGRCIVFVNSIPILRRVAQLLVRLQVPARALHAAMQQRARIKTLERFREDPNGVLVATDVAARGLDIPLVQHVVHYDVPASRDTYTHRSGRAAHQPGAGVGVSVVLADRRDERAWDKVRNMTADFKGCKQVGAHSAQFRDVDKSVRLARKLVAAAAALSKQATQRSWKQQTAAQLGIELDDEAVPEVSGDEAQAAPGVETGTEARGIRQARARVADLETQVAAAVAALPPVSRAPTPCGGGQGGQGEGGSSGGGGRRGVKTIVLGGRAQLDGLVAKQQASAKGQHEDLAETAK